MVTIDPVVDDRRWQLAPGTTVGDYRIDELIGEGGTAAVYSATHLVIGKRAAIKVIAPELLFDAVAMSRFLDEARTVNAIGHPNIVDVFAFGELPDGRSYFVMELLEGETLYDLLERRNLSLEEALEVLEQLCDALAAAHDKGVVHRDVKPGNIFVVAARNGRRPIKLLDFGLAKSVVKDDRCRTMAGTILGTPAYMSPEQIRLQWLDGRADVYALGVVAYEILGGCVPFDGDDPWETAHLQCEATPEPLRPYGPVPEALERLILRMLAKEAVARPTIAEVAAALRAVREVPPPREASAPMRRRSHGPWLALLSLVSACIVCAMYLAAQRRAGLSTATAPETKTAPPSAEPVIAVADPPAAKPSSEVAPEKPSRPPEEARPRPPVRMRKVGRKQGRDYVLDPFAWTP